MPRIAPRGPRFRRMLVEIGVLYAVIVAIELLVTGGRVGALGASPHPYWVVVLPMAASRGTVAGILAALVGTLLEIIGLAQIDELRLAHLLDLGPFGQGVLFFGAAFLIGELHDSHARRFRQLGDDLDQERDLNARLHHERAVLEAATHHLRGTVQERPSLRRSLLHGAVRIESRTRESLAAAMLDLVREQCHASKASVWVVDADRRVLLMRSSGWSSDEEAQRIAALRASGRVRSVIERARSLDAFVSDEGPRRDEPLLVAPLSDGRGVLWGLLCLDDIEPVYLNTETSEIFFGLAEWMTAALMRIDREGAREKPQDELQDVGRLAERLWLEYDRAARYGGPLRVLGIRVVSDVSGRRADESAADEALYAGLQGLPWGEAPYRFGYPHCYVLVAPMVHDRDLEDLQRRLIAAGARHHVAFESFVVSLDGETPDLHSLIDACASRFRETALVPLAATPPVRVPASLRIGDGTDLRRRLRHERALAARTHRPLQAVILRIADGNGAAERALAYDATRATGALRPVDGLYQLGDGRFVLVLPFTDPDGARISVQRFLQVLEERNPDAPYLPVRIEIVDPLELDAADPGASRPERSG